MTTGIIAEFNPLHKGHEALIKFAKKNSGACVVVLSSNFTQRGSPSIIDKFFRAFSAVKAGADLVIELPFLFACSAGQDFARGGVDLLAKTNFITHIAFGMEDPDFNFKALLNFQSREDYKNFLRRELDLGASFPKAHALALEKIFPGSKDFLTRPNNLLGLSYLNEIEKNNLKILPLILKREGPFKSKDIRENLFAPDSLLSMPEYSREILSQASRAGRISNEKNLWPLLQNIFIRSSANDLKKIYGVDEGIENLFLKHWKKSSSLEDFIGCCVCARYTRAHIRRRLIYILLGLERFEMIGALRNGVPYARVLAFNSTGRKILKDHSKNSPIKFITSLSRVDSPLEKFFARVEFQASQLYELLVKNPDMTREVNTVLQF